MHTNESTFDPEMKCRLRSYMYKKKNFVPSQVPNLKMINCEVILKKSAEDLAVELEDTYKSYKNNQNFMNHQKRLIITFLH